MTDHIFYLKQMRGECVMGAIDTNDNGGYFTDQYSYYNKRIQELEDELNLL